MRATLRSALAAAERAGLVTVNVARLAEVEAGKRPKVRPLEPAELGRLLDHLAADPLGAFYETVAATGLRCGEALALRWDDVDLERGRIIVRQQLVQLGGRHACPYCDTGHKGMMFAAPKTSSGEARAVELDSHTTGLLLGHRLRQDAERDTWGDAYADHGLVFARENGEPFRRRRGDQAVRRAVRRRRRSPGAAA